MPHNTIHILILTRNNHHKGQDLQNIYWICGDKVFMGHEWNMLVYACFIHISIPLNVHSGALRDVNHPQKNKSNFLISRALKVRKKIVLW